MAAGSKTNGNIRARGEKVNSLDETCKIKRVRTIIVPENNKEDEENMITDDQDDTPEKKVFVNESDGTNSKVTSAANFIDEENTSSGSELFNKKRLKTKWTDAAITKLLNVMCNENIRFELFNASSSVKKHSVYNKIKDLLNEEGFDYTLENVILKLKKLRIKYKNELTKARLCGSASKAHGWKYFKLMSMIYDLRANENRTCTDDYMGAYSSPTLVNSVITVTGNDSTTTSIENVVSSLPDNVKIRTIDSENEPILHKVFLVKENITDVTTGSIDTDNDESNDVGSSSRIDTDSSVIDESVVRKKDKLQLNDDPDMLFLRSLLPDIKQLNDSKKRIFKIRMQQSLHELLYSSESFNLSDHQY